jgi:hypothetical protein
MYNYMCDKQVHDKNLLSPSLMAEYCAALEASIHTFPPEVQAFAEVRMQQLFLLRL